EEVISARDWSDLPDWSEVQPWFEGGDWSSVDAWSALEAQPAATVPASEGVVAPAASDERFVSMPLDVSHLRSLPPRPVYVLDRLVRFDQPPRPADGQDNGAESGPRTDEAAAIRSAFLPSAAPAASGLSLVFGPGIAAEPEAPRRAPVLSAMAARAAIRAAGQPSPLPPAPPAQPEAVPAPTAAASVTERAEQLRREAALATERERERYEIAADAYRTALLGRADEEQRRLARRAASEALSGQINSNLREPPLVE
ncbi:MAG: hypothetical protein JOY56_01475, partial [Solirubrobacterales bacterium]|nr:hypothetical protein [Solirubrobacterales bacterium]